MPPLRSDAPDWLGACRRSAAAIRAMLADRPTIAERVQRDRHARRGRRPHAADRRGGRGRRLRRAATSSTTRAPASRALSEERGVVDFGGDGTCCVVIDPIDGSVNAKRGLPHYRAVRSRSPTAATMADVVFGFVQDFGPDEEWVAWRGGGAQLDGVPLDPSLGERRTADGKLEVLGDRVRRPALGRPVRRRAGRDRPPAAGDRRDGGLALPGRGRALRRDGLAAALPRGRRRGRAADRARGRRPGRVHRLRRSARRAAGHRAALAGDRRAHARGPRRRSGPSRSGPCHPREM